MRSLVLFLGSIVLLGCSQDRQVRRAEVAELSARHQKELAWFESAQADFKRRNPVPRQQDFEGDGTILVHECELRGWPGHEQFWLKYTWMNTTGRTVDEAHITITLRDQGSGAEQSEEMELSLPLLYRLGPDSSYTTNILVPIRGMHSPPALEWTIRPRGVIQTRAR
jgi:hypothetical protein